MPENSIEDVVRETLETAFGTAALLEASRKSIAPRVTFLITEHARAGKFLGGGSQEDGSGYSEATLPAFFLGELESSGGQWKLRNEALNKTVTPREDELIWRTNEDGEPRAYLLGGYRKFRELAGRSTDFVNLTFTGNMLGNVESRAKVQGGNVHIETTSVGYEDRAGFTDAMYEWLGLFENEQRDIREKLERWIDDLLDNRPDVTVTDAG